MFGKLMSVSDELMWKYMLLLTDRGTAEIEAERQQVGDGVRHPMDVKKELAGMIVTEFHSAEAATSARQEFERVFSARNLPQEIPEVSIATEGESMLLSKVIVEGGLAASNSEARRLIQQGGVKVDGEPVSNVKAELSTGGSDSVVLQVGKRRFAKVVFDRRG
jgi:tyrosyl-tRNA synthetase